MFRIVASTNVFNGQLHYHIRLMVKRGHHERICGVIDLRGDEWPEFLKICEQREVPVELSTQTAETCAPR